MKLWKEIDDCDSCPLREEGLCKAGEFNPSSDGAYEPICDSFDPDEEVDAIIRDLWDRVYRAEAAYDARVKAAREKEQRKQIAQKRSSEARWHVMSETREIRRLRDRIAKNEAAVNFASSLAFAFNTTNEMFGYEECYKPRRNEAIEAENEQMTQRIKELEQIKKAKLAELRQQRRQDA